MFTTPFPWYVKLMWSVISVLLIAGGLFAYSNQRKAEKARGKVDAMNIYDP